LFKIPIAAYEVTEVCRFDVGLMLDRNTELGVKEKAFHLTELKVFQLHGVLAWQLYLISIINASGTIVGITDDYIILEESVGVYPVWEYADMSSYLTRVEFAHEIQEASYCTLGVRRPDIMVEKGMFMRILGTFTTDELDRLYKGTYNFRDDANGDEPAGWTTNNGADCITTVISSLDGHKKVLQIYDDNGAAKCGILKTITQSADQTIELWLGKGSIAAAKNGYIELREGATRIIYLRLDEDDLDSYSAGAWNSIKDTFIAASELFHLKIILDDTANTFDCYINGVLESAGESYENNSTTSIDTVFFGTGTGDNDLYFYVASIGLSSDANYNVGDNLSVEAGETDQVIFEGIVVDFDGERLQKVWLESPAKKELERKPRGYFSGRSDEIMASLVSTYCKYITVGTLSEGTAMGTITYAGDKTLKTIFNELALFEKWIWKLDPQGRLFFNDGTVDTLVDLSKTDKIFRVKTGEIREPYNYFYLKGALVSGVQLVKELEEADDLVSQQQYGYNPFEETYASFNSQTILDQLTTNVKARLKETPLVVEFWHYDSDLGMLAIGETVTLVYDTTNVNVSSDQFLINRVLFKAKENVGGYTIADELV